MFSLLPQNKYQSDPYPLPLLRPVIYKTHEKVQTEIFQKRDKIFIRLFAQNSCEIPKEDIVEVETGVSITIPSPCLGVIENPENTPHVSALRVVQDKSFSVLPKASTKVKLHNLSETHSAFIWQGQHIATVRIYLPIMFEPIITFSVPPTSNSFMQTKRDEQLKGEYLTALSNPKNEYLVREPETTGHPTQPSSLFK
jgi:hypothetical protein